MVVGSSINKSRVAVIGSGPAAWSAAIYLARAQLRPSIFTGRSYGGPRGGQLMTTEEVENYPGFPLGVGGPELVKVMEAQARRFGCDVYEEDVIGVKRGFIVNGTSTSLNMDSVVVATGAFARRLNVKGDSKFWQKGVSACALCDGPLPIFRDKDLLVIGGGDTACEEAIFLSKYAKIVHMALRRNVFRASKILSNNVISNPKINILYEYQLSEIFGKDLVEGVILVSKDGEHLKLAVSGVFYAVGHIPNTSFLKDLLSLDSDGYIKIDGTTATSVEGIFAAGDVSDKVYRQAVTAAGSGCMAAIDVERWLHRCSL